MFVAWGCEFQSETFGSSPSAELVRYVSSLGVKANGLQSYSVNIGPMGVIVEESGQGGNEGVGTAIFGEDAVKHARGAIFDDVSVVVAMCRRHMVTVRVHREVVTRGDRSVCFMVVSTHLTTAAKDTALTQWAIRLLILAGEVSIDRIGSVPVKSIRSSVVRDRVQVIKRRGTCNGRREHCNDIVRARPVAR